MTALKLLRRRLLDLKGGWHAAETSTRESAIFVRQEGTRQVCYDMDAAIRAGMLREVAQARGHTQENLVKTFEVGITTVRNWWRGRAVPRGDVQRQAVRSYLTRD
jgi:DNA-binding transcriptional regulator YiaG